MLNKSHSFLNKTLLEGDKEKVKIQRPRTVKKDFVKLNKDMIKEIKNQNKDDADKEETGFEVSRPFTPRTYSSSALHKFSTTRK